MSHWIETFRVNQVASVDLFGFGHQRSTGAQLASCSSEFEALLRFLFSLFYYNGNLVCSQATFPPHVTD